MYIVPNTTPERCKLHPAFDADYCPSCGTSQIIGANGNTRPGVTR
jgi:hypothetical protein